LCDDSVVIKYSLCDTGDIVASVVILEDISSDDAKHLGSLLSMIQDKAGGLFQAPDEQNVNVKVELQRNVPKWLRFTEQGYLDV
jgi:hypothetical protein